MARTRQWTIEPIIIDENNTQIAEPKYNISYSGANESELVFTTTTNAANITLVDLLNYRAVELTTTYPVTLGICTATTATVVVEFPEITNFIIKGNISVGSTTSVWYVRTTGVDTAVVTMKVITS
jgi:hypothetical protein